MRGDLAHCPKTGALLSEERYPREWHPALSIRAPEPDKFNEAPMTPMGQGANFSAASGIKGYFRRKRDRHAPDSDPSMDRQACLAIDRLKEPERDTHDDYLWFALAEWLHRHGDYPLADLEWMRACVEPGCPSCHCPLRWEQDVHGTVLGSCSVGCKYSMGEGDSQYVTAYANERITEIVKKAFNRAFRADDVSKPIREVRFLAVN